MRLALAVLVIISHTWPLGGFGDDPHLGDLTLGSWAVGAFFTISGYLICASRSRTSLLEFARRRALRIYPGYLVCLVLVAFAFAPLTALLEGTGYNAVDAAGFVWRKASTVVVQAHVSTDPTGVVWRDTSNGSLDSPA